MSDIYLHIGLHKTGTKFFQHKLFPYLNKDKYDYNPPKITQLIADLYKADKTDTSSIIDKIHNEKTKLSNSKKTLISREIMASDLFSFYQDFEEKFNRLAKAFPEAKIIFATRFQTDWILSCYRESIHEHHYQSIDDFLTEDENKPFIGNDYRKLDYYKIFKTIYSLYKDESIFHFFYEDFRSKRDETIKNVLSFIGSEFVKPVTGNDTIPNRGYSAFSIKLSLIRFKLLSIIGLKSLVHRPIVFFGPKGIPAGYEDLSELPKEKYWHDGFLRDNEEIRSKNYPNIGFFEKLKQELSWRSIIKKRIDQILYLDKDLLSHRRDELNKYFREQNIKIAKDFNVKKMPLYYKE